MSELAVIFDLDGVITDSAEMHFTAWTEVAHSFGINFTREDNEDLRGISRIDSLIFILKLGGVTLDDDTFEATLVAKNTRYLAMLEQLTPDDLLPGVGPLLDELDAASVPFALGSASRNARNVLTNLGQLERFKFIADGNSPVKKKPEPDLFLYAANGLGVSAENCVVIEDALAGVQAAQAANMACVAVGEPERFGEHLTKPRTHNCMSLTEIDLATLRTLATG